MTAIRIERSALLSTSNRSRRSTSVRTIRIGIAGAGTVGAALLRLLREQALRLEERHRVRFVPTAVLVRDTVRARGTDVPSALLTGDVDRFSASEAEIIVEATGDVGRALTIARRALADGRGFITANKALVVAHGAALEALAERRALPFRFEASVGGGVPIVAPLRDGAAGEGITTITGVLNGTTNYLLTRVAEGLSREQALAEARERGFAEADPTRDLSGRDAADKIAILAWLAWGADPSRIEVESQALPAELAGASAAALARGGVLKQIASAQRDREGKVRAWVRPVVVPEQLALARVRGVENLVQVESESRGLLSFGGPGAGGTATASAILADLLAAGQATR